MHTDGKQSFENWWTSMPTCYSTSQRLMPNGKRIFKSEADTPFRAGFDAALAALTQTINEQVDRANPCRHDAFYDGKWIAYRHCLDMIEQAIEGEYLA